MVVSELDPTYLAITQIITIILLTISEYLGVSNCKPNGLIDGILKALSSLKRPVADEASVVVVSHEVYKEPNPTEA
jgi:hypothetical protein